MIEKRWLKIPRDGRVTLPLDIRRHLNCDRVRLTMVGQSITIEALPESAVLVAPKKRQGSTR